MGARIYKDYRDLLTDAEVEVVHICTPNVSHSEIAVAAFGAKKHVYCEKPMSHSTEEAEKMVAAWKASGMQFTVGYQNRFRPEVQNLHAACQKGELGDIYYGKAHAVRRRGVPTWGVFMDKAAQGGGGEEDTIDCRQWLEAVQKGTEPLVKPEAVFRCANQLRL
ncbi:myo-inositol 2-dehydrogenase [Muribaculaceae bacterium]|nr:myo-inositol 2-dehydrogenase [Muribaculaceae bacterium]